MDLNRHRDLKVESSDNADGRTLSLIRMHSKAFHQLRITDNREINGVRSQYFRCKCGQDFWLEAGKWQRQREKVE